MRAVRARRDKKLDFIHRKSAHMPDETVSVESDFCERNRNQTS